MLGHPFRCHCSSVLVVVVVVVVVVVGEMIHNQGSSLFSNITDLFSFHLGCDIFEFLAIRVLTMAKGSATALRSLSQQ
jgi:hypothetical protein